MADVLELEQIELPSGGVYNFSDISARSDIETLKQNLANSQAYLGVTTTALSDGLTTAAITIKVGDTETKQVTPKNGQYASYNNVMFGWNGTQWDQWGSAGAIKALAYKDSASGSTTPSGSVSQPSFTGTETTSTGSFTPSGSVAVTLNTASVTPISGVGTLPSFTATVSGKKLTLGFSAGSLPTKGTAVTVATSVKSAGFTGTAGNVSVKGTPAGTVSKPTFTGTAATVTVK